MGEVGVRPQFVARPSAVVVHQLVAGEWLEAVEHQPEGVVGWGSQEQAYLPVHYPEDHQCLQVVSDDRVSVW